MTREKFSPEQIMTRLLKAEGLLDRGTSARANPSFHVTAVSQIVPKPA